MRADDPLAFGVEHLRHARATYRADLRQLWRTLPADRRDHLTAAERDLHRAQEHLRYARRTHTDAHQQLEQAHQRHWGRRDKPAIQAAVAGVERAEANLSMRATPKRQPDNGSNANNEPSTTGPPPCATPPINERSSPPPSPTSPTHSTAPDPNASQPPLSIRAANSGEPSAHHHPPAAASTLGAASPNKLEAAQDLALESFSQRSRHPIPAA